MAEHAFENLPFLASIADGATPEACRVWLRVATDHFVTRDMHTQDQLLRFGHSAIKFLGIVDGATRLIVAKKLSLCASTPEAVLERIVDLGGPAAHHVLQCARGLPRSTLTEAAQSATLPATLVALREDLDRGLVALLAQRADEATLSALAGNLAAPLDAPTFAALAGLAHRKRDVALALLARQPVGMRHAALFLHADAAQRRAILVDAQRAALGRAEAPARPALDQESLAQLEHLSIARQVDLFELGLSEALGCDLAIGEAIVRERSGEPLAVALAALGAPEDMAMRILISNEVHAGVDAPRIAALARLRDVCTQGAAQRVMAAVAGASQARRAAYRPVLDATAAAAPGRTLAGEAAQPASRRRRALEFIESHRAKSA